MDLIEDYSKEYGITYEEALKHFQPIYMESSLECTNPVSPKLTYTAKDMKELIDNDPEFKRNIEDIVKQIEERNQQRKKEENAIINKETQR